MPPVVSDRAVARVVRDSLHHFGEDVRRLREDAGAPPLDGAAVIATPVRSTIVIGGDVPQGSVLVASYDGGHTWKPVLDPAQVTFADLGFTTPTQGIVVATEQSGASRLLMTHDAGGTWTPVAF